MPAGNYPDMRAEKYGKNLFFGFGSLRCKTFKKVKTFETLLSSNKARKIPAFLVLVS